jgi:hypothetical protein
MSAITDNDKIVIHVKSMIKLMRKPITKELQQKNEDEFLKLMKEKYHQLHFKFPSIFNMVLEQGDKFDLPKLLHMLSMRQRVENNEITSHDASVVIGTEEYNTYVKPKVDKL